MIAHYKPGENDEYSLEDVLKILGGMPYLTQLKFDDLQFALYRDNPDRQIFEDPIRYIHLQDLTEGSIAHFSEAFDSILVLRVTHCPLPDTYDFYPMPETLILEDISSDVDILGVLTDWNGENLWLDRCHSFSNAFLKALGRRRSNLYPCNEMHRLLLYRLPPFSLSLLKKVIEK